MRTMSAIGPYQTAATAPHKSVFGAQADVLERLTAQSSRFLPNFDLPPIPSDMCVLASVGSIKISSSERFHKFPLSLGCFPKLLRDLHADVPSVVPLYEVFGASQVSIYDVVQSSALTPASACTRASSSASSRAEPEYTIAPSSST
jgi:hypothetical protein